MAIPGQSKGWKPRVSENGGRCRSGDVVCQAPQLKRGFQGTRFGSPALPRPHPSLSPRARFSACRFATRGQPTGGLATAPRPAPPASLTSAQGVRAGPRRAVSRAGGQLVGAGGWLRLVWATGRRTAVPADRGCGCRVLGFGGAGRGRGHVRAPACQPKARAHRDTCRILTRSGEEMPRNFNSSHRATCRTYDRVPYPGLWAGPGPAWPVRNRAAQQEVRAG